MKPNSILEDLWRVKADLAAEAGYDAGRFFEDSAPVGGGAPPCRPGRRQRRRSPPIGRG